MTGIENNKIKQSCHSVHDHSLKLGRVLFSDSPNGDVNINEQLSETICLLFIFLFYEENAKGVFDLFVTISNSMPHIDHQISLVVT